MPFNTVGCDLEAPVKGGGILDRMRGHSDLVTR